MENVEADERRDMVNIPLDTLHYEMWAQAVRGGLVGLVLGAALATVVHHL